jgi:hypothetical protein
VGQWIAEVESWEFGRGEEVQEISMWTSNETEVKSHGYAKIGKVIGISLTASSSKFEKLPVAATGAVRVNFRANMLEKLVCISFFFPPRICY